LRSVPGMFAPDMGSRNYVFGEGVILPGSVIDPRL
jgi:hypothetical protein